MVKVAYDFLLEKVIDILRKVIMNILQNYYVETVSLNTYCLFAPYVLWFDTCSSLLAMIGKYHEIESICFRKIYEAYEID